MIPQILTDKLASSLLSLGGLLPTTIAVASCTTLLAFGSTMAQVAAPEPRELSDLRSRFQADSQTVVKPLQDRYILQLQVLMRTLTQRGDLDGALAVKQELKTQGFGAEAAVSAVSPFSGTNWQADDSKVHFMSNGAWVEEYQGQHYYGQWRTTDDKDAIEVTRTNGSKLHYKLADDGKTSRRDEGGLTYYRLK